MKVIPQSLAKTPFKAIIIVSLLWFSATSTHAKTKQRTPPTITIINALIGQKLHFKNRYILLNADNSAKLVFEKTTKTKPKVGKWWVNNNQLCIQQISKKTKMCHLVSAIFSKDKKIQSLVLGEQKINLTSAVSLKN